jgi:uncharacterized membrane protein YcaP (DUF421 family)
MGSELFFRSWSGVAGSAVSAVVAYLLLLVLLRVSGKRSLSKLTTFDLVITVALGSMLSTTVLDQHVPIAEGLAALLVLVGAQYLFACLTRSRSRVRDLIEERPALLALRGELLPGVLDRERIGEPEILAAVRDKGLASLEQAWAIVLETNGSISVIREPAVPASALKDVIPEPRAPPPPPAARGRGVRLFFYL